MKNQLHLLFLFLVIGTTVSCGSKKTTNENQPTTSKIDNSISEDSLLTLVQYQTFQYFWENAEPNSGLARERTHMDGHYPQNDQNVVTTGGSGFGLMAILIGIERGFITREEGFQHLKKAVDFLEKADRFYGAWPHWLHGETGKTKAFS